jgi:hypothetical protein
MSSGLGLRKVCDGVSRFLYIWRHKWRCRAWQTYDLVLGLVALRLEVEIVIQRVVAALVDRREHDAHVELAPALLVDAERRLLEDCAQ